MPSLPISDPVLIFAITMVIILVAPLVVVRLRMPGLVGLILAGMVVGPSVLGLLERDATFQLLGTVGLLYLMFVAGVTLDLGQFAKLRGRSIGFGVASFFIPQLGALFIGINVLEWSMAQSLLLGSIVGSHTLLAYPVADRLGIIDNRGIVMAVGATMVTDILSLGVLAVVIASVAGDPTVAYWIRFATFVAVWAAVVILVLPRLGTWFFRNVRQGAALDFAFLMAMLFLTAWLAGVVGLAPIIGAFMAGLLLNRLVPAQSPLMTRIKFMGDALLIPFFLVSVGMLIDVRVLFASVELWLLAIVFSLLVILGKSLAAKLSQLVFRLSGAEGWTVAGLTIPQAAATLAVTLVAFEVGLFSELVVNSVVVMILITSLLGPSLVERFGRTVALEEEARQYDPAAAPERILVPLANPETAPALMDLALAVRDVRAQQPVYPLVVASEGADEAAAVAASEKLLAHAVVHGAAADVPVTPITRVDQNIARGIERAVRERRISTVIIGWNGESSARARVFGSVLDQFLEESRAMVLVSKLEHPLSSTRRVVLLVPPYAEREVGFAKALAAVKTMTARIGAVLLLVTVETIADDLASSVERTSPEVGFRVARLASWADLMTTLDDAVREGDLICLLSARRGTLAWRPSLLQTPGIIAKRWPDHDFVTIYLSEQTTEANTSIAQGGGDEVDALPPLPLEHVTVGVRDGSLQEVLERLLAPAFPDQHDRAQEAVEEIVTQQADYVPELAPGLVLYHLHTGLVNDCTLFLGTSENGLTLPQTSHPARLILVLLAPLSLDAHAYLRQLSLTAQHVRQDGLVDAVASKRTAEEVRAELLTATQSDVAADTSQA
jgi:Kef-type K+ transport system membrane component KefB